MLLAYQILRLHTYQQTFWISLLDYWSLRFIFASQSSLFVYLFGFLTSLWTTKLYRGRAPRQSVWPFYVLPHMRQSWETMTSVSAGHIILTPTQPVGSGRPQRELNPGPPYQESSALPTELPRPPPVSQEWSFELKPPASIDRNSIGIFIFMKKLGKIYFEIR